LVGIMFGLLLLISTAVVLVTSHSKGVEQISSQSVNSPAAEGEWLASPSSFTSNGRSGVAFNMGGPLVETGAAADVAKMTLVLKPFAIEIGALLLCQAVGLPLLSKLGGIVRRLRWSLPLKNIRLGQPAFRLISAARQHARLLSRHGTGVWKRMVSVYSKTSASKIVTRSKKLIKLHILQQHEDEEAMQESSHAFSSSDHF
jgi:hypothetical protein